MHFLASIHGARFLVLLRTINVFLTCQVPGTRYQVVCNEVFAERLIIPLIFIAYFTVEDFMRTIKSSRPLIAGAVQRTRHRHISKIPHWRDRGSMLTTTR